MVMPNKPTSNKGLLPKVSNKGKATMVESTKTNPTPDVANMALVGPI